MAQVVHLLAAAPDALALATMQRQLEAGDRVIVALFEAVDAGRLPARAAVRRVPEELDYPQLVDLVFESDQVLAW
jgi:hypothetical protein